MAEQGLYADRVQRALAVGALFKQYLEDRPPSAEDELDAERYIAGLDPQEKVGKRHHTVPSFLLRRWGDVDGRIQVYSRVDRRTSTRMIDDLGQRDFYTFFDTNGEKNSLMESALSLVEEEAAPVIATLLNPFVRTGQ